MTRNVLVLVLVAILVSTLANGYIADSNYRLKRQMGDLRTAEIRALIALSKNPAGCFDIACGLVNVDQRLKRQTGDLKFAAIQAQLARDRYRCSEVACGVVDVAARPIRRIDSDQRIAELKALSAVATRIPGQVNPEEIPIKRTSSDQRIAELQALIALSQTIGHGQVNPEEIGKKKRDLMNNVDFRRSIFAQRLLRLAAEGLDNSS